MAFFYFGFLIYRTFDANAKIILAEEVDSGNNDKPDGVTQDSLARMYQTLGYGEPIGIPISEDSSAPASASGEIYVQTRKLKSIPTPNALSQEVIVTYPSLKQTGYKYTLLFGDSSWKAGSYDHVEGLKGEGELIDDVISRQDIRDTVKESIFVFCIGLSSSDKAKNQEITNTHLAGNRSIRLCNSLFAKEILTSGTSTQKAFGVSYGERIPEDGQGISFSRQRPTIILGLTKVDEYDEKYDLIEGIRASFPKEIVDLDKYIIQWPTGQYRVGYSIFQVQDDVFIDANDPRWIDNETESLLTPPLVDDSIIK